MKKLAFLILAAGCSGYSVPGGAGSCTATISGAVTASGVTCYVSAGTDTNGDGNGAIGLSFVGVSADTVSAAVKTTGTPAARTYASTDANASGATELTDNNTHATWAAVAGASSGNQGTYSFDITSLGNEVSNPDGGAGNVFLTVHGSLTATLPAVTATGATGTVNISASF